MSWLDKVETGLSITCGDGKVYTPNWINASKGKEYNVATFEFKELAGTLVYRGTPKGRQYAIEIYFQGDNHLDLANAFETSADDPRAWKVSHPYYGNIIVQPINLIFDNAQYNVTKITGLIIETISTNSNVVTISAPDKIIDDKGKANVVMAGATAKNIPVLATKDKISLQANIDKLYKTISSTIRDNTDASDFFNAYNSATGALDSAITDSFSIVSQIQELISLPVDFADTLENRVNMFALQLQQLGNAIANILTPNDKRFYENNAGTLISGMIAASVTNTGTSYNNRNAVLNIIGIIVDNWNAYLTNLDTLQTPNGGNTNSYIADPDGVTTLTHLVNYAVNALLAIANNSKQERSILLEEDSNVILLANRFYGLKSDDSTIDYFISTNNIGINELLKVSKGRKIIYYV